MAASSAPTGAIISDEALARIMKLCVVSVTNPHKNGGRGARKLRADEKLCEPKLPILLEVGKSVTTAAQGNPEWDGKVPTVKLLVATLLGADVPPKRLFAAAANACGVEQAARLQNALRPTRGAMITKVRDLSKAETALERCQPSDTVLYRAGARAAAARRRQELRYWCQKPR